MSDRLTSVRVKGMRQGLGFADYGRHGRAEMIAKLRRIAELDKATAEKILAATDDQFIVETYVGVWAQRNLVEVTE